MLQPVYRPTATPYVTQNNQPYRNSNQPVTLKFLIKHYKNDIRKASPFQIVTDTLLHISLSESHFLFKTIVTFYFRYVIKNWNIILAKLYLYNLVNLY